MGRGWGRVKIRGRGSDMVSVRVRDGVKPRLPGDCMRTPSGWRSLAKIGV